MLAGTPFINARCLGAAPRPFAARRLPLVVAAARQDGEQQPQPPKDNDAPTPTPSRRRRRRAVEETEAESFTLENLNPISMGRKARVFYDDVWSQLQRIGGPSRSTPTTLQFELEAPEAYESPRASETNVLVTGATGRVGRVLVRKLLLRGYKVRALVRRRGEDDASPATEAIPQSVEVVYGDVGDYKACRAAVEGINKVICCSGARTTITADLNRVDHEGVANLARAMLDSRNAAARKAGAVAPVAKIDVADFADEAYHPLWDVEHVGPPDLELAKKGYYAQTRRKARDTARDTAEAFINETDSLVFEGAVYSRDGYAQVGAALKEMPHSGSIVGTEGLLMRIKGDAHQYSAVAETTDGRVYSCKFPTRLGFSTVRLPWSSFNPVKNVDLDAPAAVLDPADVARLSFRFDPKVRVLQEVTEAGGSMYDNTGYRFTLEIDWVKALPGGEETDFVLVSCAGARAGEMDPAERERVIGAKRRGEAALRNSGLGYTIVRPGPLAEEAGGYKALVFDQGNRITERVACADVADVCLKSLHDDLARNKTFEMCWEYTPEEGLESWDLLCHFPDKGTAYLAQALRPLQKNT